VYDLCGVAGLATGHDADRSRSLIIPTGSWLVTVGRVVRLVVGDPRAHHIVEHPRSCAADAEPRLPPIPLGPRPYAAAASAAGR